MSGRTWEVAARGRTDVGEGPAWDAREGVLWFIDVTPGALYRLDPASGDVDVRLVGLPIGAAIPSREGGLILALEDGVHQFVDQQAIDGHKPFDAAQHGQVLGLEIELQRRVLRAPRPVGGGGWLLACMLRAGDAPSKRTRDST